MRIKQLKKQITRSLSFLFVLLSSATAYSQVNSGSDGSDGVLNPSADIVIDMADHPDGIYHYTSVNIPLGVTVSFIPNPANTPVVWLVQSDCSITGAINLDGQDTEDGGLSGAGGFRGGHGGSLSVPAGDGLGPGGGVATATKWMGANASYGTLGEVYPSFTYGTTTKPDQDPPGELYGNNFLLPLIGGSGGAGIIHAGGIGGGGGGAFLVAASGKVTLNGAIYARGGRSDNYHRAAGGGSGGGIRLVGTIVTGDGSMLATGGLCYEYYNGHRESRAGSGRIRIDAMDNTFIGTADGSFTFGFQPIILLPNAQAVSLSIESIGGVTVNPSPTASPITPDVVVPANAQNPVTMVVKCTNIPLNTEVIVDAKPANGPVVRVAAFNNVGTQSESFATIQINLPRGAGTIQAKAVSGIVNGLAAVGVSDEGATFAQTGWLATGERFTAVEVTSVLGGKQSLVYISESGKRHSLGNQ